MRKIEVFLPLPGMTVAMNSYFDKPHVWHMNGLPTGPELPEGNWSEAELLAFGYDAASDKLAELTLGEDEVYGVAKEYPFITELYDDEGNQLGWEFEFDVWSN